MEDSFLLFLAVGFVAQLIDGALGMAYGVVSSTVLLSFGVPPAAACSRGGVWVAAIRGAAIETA